MQPLLELSNVSFSYGKDHVLKNLSLKINAGSICCILGPSGCGKTSLIRMVAGFEQPTSGKIFMDSQTIADDHINVPAERRNVGMVFQDLTLFPHLTVEKNISFGLDNMPAKHRQQRIDELLELCRLNELRNRYPHQISGGQQQRVALARALAPKPKLLLLDEPFSSVDSSLQRELCQEVRNVLVADNATAIWVTHDLEEAFMVSDRIGLFIDGELQQWAAPEQLYEDPANLIVAKFLNHCEMLDARVQDNNIAMTSIGALSIKQKNNERSHVSGRVLINRKDFLIDNTAKPNAILVNKTYIGGQYLLTVKFNKGEMITFQNVENRYQAGDAISVSVQPKSYPYHPLRA